MAIKKVYSLVGLGTSKIIQKMVGATDFIGKLPGTPTESDHTQLFPTITSGQGLFDGLDKGGVFNFKGRTLVIEDLFGNGCTPVWTIVYEPNPSGAPDVWAIARALPDLPFKLAPNEQLRAISTGAVAGAEVGVATRLDTETR